MTTDKMFYTCEACGGTFWSDRSDEEALKEAEQTFGGPIPEDEQAVVCDDCYKDYLVWLKTEEGSKIN